MHLMDESTSVLETLETPRLHAATLLTWNRLQMELHALGVTQHRSIDAAMGISPPRGGVPASRMPHQSEKPWSCFYFFRV